MTLSSIQRRYNLSSTQSGLVVSVFDMAVIVSVAFISYFGGKGHKPRWLGIGLLVQGFGELGNDMKNDSLSLSDMKLQFLDKKII